MKESFYLIQSGNNSRVETNFTPNLELDGPYEIALHSLETYYAFPNVDERITRFVFLWIMELDGTI